MANGSLFFERHEVLKFNPVWSESDRLRLGAFLERNGDSLTYKDEQEFRLVEISAAVVGIPATLSLMRLPMSGGYVSGRDGSGAEL